MDNKEGRVCTPCKTILERLDMMDQGAHQQQSEEGVATAPVRQPNPANPMEYCSTVPVAEQVRASGSAPPPSVMVPVGVLKRQETGGASGGGGENKSVMFSDGIRPGGDLTELDGREGHRTLGRRPGSRGKSGRRRGRGVAGPVGAQDVAASMLPPEGLPLVSGRVSILL